jgi:sigma-E factor negative regulatory protein RseC
LTKTKNLDMVISTGQNMNTEEGTITRVEGNKAWVLVARSEMCDCCGSRSVCHTLGGGENMEAEALNTIKAREGDRVQISIKPGILWKISMLFYMIPVIALITGALIGVEIGPHLKTNPDVVSAFLGISFAALSYIIIRKIANRLKEKKDYMPEVVRVVNP